MMQNHNTQFSLFGYGYRNHQGEAVLQTKPEGVADIWSVYQYITSPTAKEAQDTLRAMRDTATKAECSDFKKLNFRFACFRGIFFFAQGFGTEGTVSLCRCRHRRPSLDRRGTQPGTSVVSRHTC